MRKLNWMNFRVNLFIIAVSALMEPCSGFPAKFGTSSLVGNQDSKQIVCCVSGKLKQNTNYYLEAEKKIN